MVLLAKATLAVSGAASRLSSALSRVTGSLAEEDGEGGGFDGGDGKDLVDGEVGGVVWARVWEGGKLLDDGGTMVVEAGETVVESGETAAGMVRGAMADGLLEAERLSDVNGGLGTAKVKAEVSSGTGMVGGVGAGAAPLAGGAAIAAPLAGGAATEGEDTGVDILLACVL